MPRLPQDGGDIGEWGGILNQFLLHEHLPDGSHAPDVAAVKSVSGKTGDIALSSSDVGLGNVTNDAQLKTTDLDTDTSLAANSDIKIPSQKAVKAYADENLAGFTSELQTKAAKTGDTFTGNLAITSTFDGGENTSDSTKRLNLNSHQRAQNPNHFGEVIRAELSRANAKAMFAWRENYTGSGPRSVAWVGAHGQSNDGASWHNHFSVETPDETGQLQTRLEIPFAPFDSPNGYGIPNSDAYTRATSKLIVGGGYPMIVEGSAGSNRNLNFSSGSYGADADKRWAIRADSTAESGSNVGSDLRIVPHTDGGAAGNTALFIKRSTGQVGIGTINPSNTLEVGGSALATSAGTTTIGVSRGLTTNFASFSLRTNSVEQWSLGLRNDSTNDLHFRDTINARTPFKIQQSTGNIETTGSITCGGGLSTALSTKSSNYTLTTNDSVILVDSTTGIRTMTLPSAVSATGRAYTIKDWKGTAATNNITISTTASQTIDGQASLTLSTNFAARTLVSDGANWSIISSH